MKIFNMSLFTIFLLVSFNACESTTISFGSDDKNDTKIDKSIDDTNIKDTEKQIDDVDTNTSTPPKDPIDKDTNTSTPPKDLDTIAPIFSTKNQISVNENQINVTTIVAKDDVSKVKYTLSGKDAQSFNLDSSSGKLTFKSIPDFETKDTYNIEIKANDKSNNTASLDLKVLILDIDENVVDTIAPILKIPKSINVYEHDLDVITLSAVDEQSSITYHIALGQSAAYFNVDSVSGKVTFKEEPVLGTISKYGFRPYATDSAGNSDIEYLTINIIDIDENSNDTTPPKITSSDSINIDENQRSVMTISATDDESTPTFTLAGTDANSFNVDLNTGVVTFRLPPDYERKNTYYITSIATDRAGNKAKQDVTININDVFEEADNRTDINIIDLNALASNEGVSVKEYLVNQLEQTFPQKFETSDSTIFRYSKDAPYTPDNWAGNFDFTGIAWNSIQAGTLITNQHIVLASHFARSVGTKVQFYAKDGTLVERYIVATRTLGTIRDGSDYDDRIFDTTIEKLDRPVPNKIKVYSIIDARDTKGYKYSNQLDDAPYVYTDQKKKAYLGGIQALYNYTYNGQTKDSFIFDGQSYTGYKSMYHTPIGGDSGNPSFLYVDGELTLLSTLSTSGYGERMSGPFYPDFEQVKYLKVAIKEMLLE